MSLSKVHILVLSAFLMLSLFCLRLIFGNANPVAFNDVSPMYNIDQLFRPYDFPWDYKSNLGAPIFLTGNTVYNVPLLGLSVLFGSVTLAHKILLVLLIGFAGFGFYLAFSYLLKSRSAGFIAGLVMLFCPFILTRWISGHNTILLVYMVLPYALLVFLMMMRVGGKHSIVLCGLLTGLMIYISPQIAYLFLLFAILYGVFDLIFSRRVAIFSCFKIRLLQFSILIGITLLVAFPFFYPLLMVNLPVYATRAEEMAVSFLSPATSSMLLSQVALVVFIFASLTFLFWKQLIGGLFGKVKNDANVYSSAIGNLVSVRFAEILLFAMLGLLSMCIICLALFYAPGYYWLFNNIPGFGMFREVDKFLLFTALSVAFFLGLITEAFKRYVTKLNLSVFVRKSLPIILISLIVLSSSWPYLSGDLNGAVKTVEIPESYQNLDSWLRAQNDTFRVAFFPPAVWATTYNWSSNWFLDPMVSLQAQPTVEIRSEMDLTQAASFSRWVYTQLYSHKISDWGRFLALLGVEYLVVRLDADMPRERNDLSAFSLVNTLAALNVQKDFVLEQDFGSVLVYRNTYSLPIVYGADDFSALIGDRRMLLSLVNSHFDFSKHPAVFLDDAVNYAELLIKNSSCVVSQGDSYWSLIVASLGAEYTVAPWLYAPVSATPWGKWVSGDLMWSFWGGALNVAPDGFIYSEGMTNITIPLNVDTFGSYRVLAQVYDGTFAVGSNGLQFLSEGTGTINHVFCDYRYTEGIYRWVDLGVSYLDDRSELILCNLGGAAAVSKIAILPEEYVKDAAQNVHDLFEESDTGMTYIFDDFSWNYSLDGVVHNSLAGDGRMINLQKSSARTSFYIFKPENYALQARFSVSGESATINVGVDGVLKEVELTGSAELVTADLGCFNLGVGYHNITLESVSGVVNLDIALLVDFAESFYGYSNLVDSNFTMVSGSEYYVTGETNNVVFLEGGYGYWNVCGSFYNDIILLPVFNYGSLFIDIGSENGCILKYAGYSYVEQSVFVAFFAMILLLVGLNFLNNKWFIVYNF